MGQWGQHRDQWRALWGSEDNVGISGGLYGALGLSRGLYGALGLQ